MIDHPRGPYMTTLSGRQVFFLDPQPEDLLIEDAAYALAGKYRWGGHSRPRWSVAQHLILAYRIAAEPFKKEAFYHDLAEAWLGDLLRPIKRMMPEYDKLEDRFCAVLALKFNFIFPFPPDIKEIDNRLGAAEARTIMKNEHAEQYYAEYPKDTELQKMIFTEDIYSVERTFLAIHRKLQG
jgi:5'-deoxynucleotidase YfbR-like HD superfamily hydrolase